jgi:hypothetical protein
MGERPNVRRVRVLVIFYKRMKSLKSINIDTKVSYCDDRYWDDRCCDDRCCDDGCRYYFCS